MPLPAIGAMDFSATVMSSLMADAGDDGYGGVADGQALFIAPFDGRVRRVGMAVEIGVNVAMNIRVRTPSGNSVDEPALPVGADKEGYLVEYPGTEANLSFSKGDVVVVESDGAPGGSRESYVMAVMERVGASDLPTNIVIYSSRIASAASAFTAPWPVPHGGAELLEVQVGNMATTTGSVVATITKNGSDTVASVTHPASSALSSTSSGRITDADRFFGPGDYCQIATGAQASAATVFAYNLIFRV